MKRGAAGQIHCCPRRTGPEDMQTYLLMLQCVYAYCVYTLKRALSSRPSPPTGTLTQWTSVRSTRTGRR